ncbi:acylphosphatase [Sphingobacterium sp. lm-10]|uniref:acylphosphatase n=1 Tax=Sphingobacterium sp. lm-10 TaxID=2944904 RepID=UPI00202263F8|nr:acylphosphatase [Sphingobacterium sp. lm-10]MCL7988672.1 acylphosphatase [Sphingobacterium sp. lm-10]
MKQWNITVTGKVQGVHFRAATKAVADQLGVKGYVVNQEDGSVFIEAVGDSFGLESIKEWCWEGPDAAAVENVQVLEVAPKNYHNFEVLKKQR